MLVTSAPMPLAWQACSLVYLPPSPPFVLLDRKREGYKEFLKSPNSKLRNSETLLAHVPIKHDF